MFRCQLCRNVVPANTKAIKIVLAKKEFQHPNRSYAQRCFDEEGNKRFKSDSGGSGFQIAKEVYACKGCADKNQPSA